MNEIPNSEVEQQEALEMENQIRSAVAALLSIREYLAGIPDLSTARSPLERSLYNNLRYIEKYTALMVSNLEHNTLKNELPSFEQFMNQENKT